MRYSLVFSALYSNIRAAVPPPFHGLKLAEIPFKCHYKYISMLQADRDRRLYVRRDALNNINVGTVPRMCSTHTLNLIRKINDEYTRKGGER